MHRTSVIVLLLTVIAALALARASSAVGPSLPAVEGGSGLATATGAVYRAKLLDGGTATELRRLVAGKPTRIARLRGGWGIQMVTISGELTGLSPNGRVLVLSDNVEPTGTLRARSGFAVVDARTLKLRKRISLRGDFSVDALSPDGRTLYLIHHVSPANAFKYQVRAYDLRGDRLLTRVIADKRQAGWLMAGFPVARGTTSGGSWVYTLYRQDGNYPFVHALDAVHRTAICIGLPENWTNDPWIDTARLTVEPGRLLIQTKTGATRYILDTTSFQVSRPAA